MTTPFDSSTPTPGGLESPPVSPKQLKLDVENGDVLLATQDSLTGEWFWSGTHLWTEEEAGSRVSFRFEPFSWSDKKRMPDRKGLVRVSTVELVRPVQIDSPSHQDPGKEYRAGWGEYL